MKKKTELLKAFGGLVLCLSATIPSAAQLKQIAPVGSLPFCDMSYDPSVRGRLFATTASSFRKSFVPRAYVSEDNGATWRCVFTFTDPMSIPEYGKQGRISEVRPSGNADDMYVVVANSSSYETDGIYRVNTKTGEYKHINIPKGEEGYAMQYFDASTDGRHIVLATVANDGFTMLTKVYYTEDGGETWKLVYDYAEHDFVHMSNVKLSPANPRKIFLLRSSGSSGVNGSIYISEDGGDTWKESLPNIDTRAIWFNPQNADELYVATELMSNMPEAVYHSADGGYTWNEIKFPWRDYIMNNVWSITGSVLDPNRMYIVEENEIYRTNDGWKTYQNVTPEGFSFGISASVNPYDDDEVLININEDASTGYNINRTTDGFATLNPVETRVSFGATGIDRTGNGLVALQHDSLWTLQSDGTINGKFAANGYQSVWVTDDNHAFIYAPDSARLGYANLSDGTIKVVKENASDVAGAAGEYIIMGGKVYKGENLEPQGAWTGRYTCAVRNESALALAAGTELRVSADNGATFNVRTAPAEIQAVALSTDAQSLLLSTASGVYVSTDGGQNFAPLYMASRFDRASISSDGKRMVVVNEGKDIHTTASYSTDGGQAWNAITPKQLHYLHSSEVLFDNDDTGINLTFASPDMGLATYHQNVETSGNDKYTLPYADDFERGNKGKWCLLSGWSVAEANQGTPATTLDDSQYKLRYVPGSNFSDVKYAISPILHLKGAPHASLTFDYAADQECNVCVLYRSSAQEQWNTLAEYKGGDWRSATVSLPNLSDEYQIAFAAQYKIVFAANPDGFGEVQIDNVRIEDKAPLALDTVGNLKAEIEYGATCQLSWAAPRGHYGAEFRIMRDGQLRGTTHDQRFTDRKFTKGHHTWTVQAVTETEQSAPASVTAEYTGALQPASNLRAVMHEAVNGDAQAWLSWEKPSDYCHATYNVYRDGTLLTTTSDTAYIDTPLDEGTFHWEVAVVYGDTESDRISATADAINRCAPVRNMELSYDVENKSTDITWDAPGMLPAEWISRCGAPAGYLGTWEAGQFSPDVAVRYTPEELQNLGLDGAVINSIAFIPGTEKATYLPRVWMGGDGTKAGTIMTPWGVPHGGYEMKIGEWNELPLYSPVTIDATKELWFGCRILFPGNKPALAFDGNKADENRNFILFDKWYETSTSGLGITGNLCIAANITMADGTKGLLRAQKQGGNGVTYEVYRDGELVGTTDQQYFSDENVPEDTYRFGVVANYAAHGKSPMVEKSFFAGNPCPAPKDLQVKADGSNVHLSWEAASPMLDLEQLFFEGFEDGMPEGWTYLDNDGDGYNWAHSSTIVGPYPALPFDGTGCAVSSAQLYDETFASESLAPDNWLITPKVSLKKNSCLKYHVSDLSIFSSETYYEVLISTTDTRPESFTKLFSETLPKTTTEVWEDRTVDLSSYSGDVYIAFRHKNDLNSLCVGLQLDDVEVDGYNEVPRQYNVYRDGELIATDVEESSYDDQVSTDDIHTWAVTTRCSELGCESNPVTATLVPMGLQPVGTTETSICYNHQSGTILVTTAEGRVGKVEVRNAAGGLVASEYGEGNRVTLFTGNMAKGVYVVSCGKQNMKFVVK